MKTNLQQEHSAFSLSGVKAGCVSISLSWHGIVFFSDWNDSIFFCFRIKKNVDSMLMFTVAAKSCTEPRPSSEKGSRIWEGTGLGHVT